MECGRLQTILEELSRYSHDVEESEVRALAQCCVHAKRIFVAGAGRSGFAARGFANRLMHLGRTVYFVGEPTTPSIGPGDMLLIGSGSGSTASLVAIAEKAKATGASIATLTIFPDSAIGHMADVVVKLPGVSPKKDAEGTSPAVSIQPMGSLFEQLSWLVYDSVVLTIMELTGETSKSMYLRHANLE